MTDNNKESRDVFMKTMIPLIRQMHPTAMAKWIIDGDEKWFREQLGKAARQALKAVQSHDYDRAMKDV